MRLSKWIPGEVIVILALFFLFFLVSFAVIPKEKMKEALHYLSTFEKGQYGASRLISIANDLHFNVEQNKQDFHLKIPDDVSVIFVLSPEQEFNIFEKSKIHEWISNGGILVYGSDIRPMLDYKLALELQLRRTMNWNFPLESPPPLVFKKKASSEELESYSPPFDKESKIETTSFKLNRPHSIFQNVSRLHSPLCKYNESLYKVVYSKKNLIQRDSGTLDDDFYSLPSIPEKDDEISFNEVESSGWTILAHDGESPSIIEKQIGSGYLIAISNPLIFANGYIDSDDNAIFVANLFNLADGGKKCLFDEYRHGFSSADKFQLMSTGWGRSVILIIAVGLLAIFSRAVRFIPARSFPPPERRSQVEYLRSMAQIYRKAGAIKMVGRIILRDLHSQSALISDDRKQYETIEKELSKTKPSSVEILNAFRKILEKGSKAARV